MGFKKRYGFTLLEVSIVLVIVGLLAAGVLVGRDLIRAAEMRKVQRQVEQFTTAINTFRTKYNCLPGDCPNATEFFGQDQSVGGQACDAIAPLGRALGVDGVCNGDGDGRYDPALSLNPGAGMEGLEAWRHLAEAGLIPGTYSGSYCDGVSYCPSYVPTFGFAADYNCPEILSTTECWLLGTSNAQGFLDHFVPLPPFVTDQSPATVLAMNLVTQAGYGSRGSSQFSPAEALQYDGKYDDGNPTSGRILVEWLPMLFGCTTTQDATAQYDSNGPNKNERDCDLIQHLGW